MFGSKKAKLSARLIMTRVKENIIFFCNYHISSPTIYTRGSHCLNAVMALVPLTHPRCPTLRLYRRQRLPSLVWYQSSSESIMQYMLYGRSTYSFLEIKKEPWQRKHNLTYNGKLNSTASVAQSGDLTTIPKPPTRAMVTKVYRRARQKAH